MSLKLKDEDSTKRMKDMQEELKDPSLEEFSDLEQDPYVIETTRTTPIEKIVYQPDGKLSSSPGRNPYIMSEEEQAEFFGEDIGDKEIRKKCVENTRNTLNKKYGVHLISNIPGVSKKIFEHGYETKLKNGTLNTSIIEDKIKDYLIEHNIEFKQ